MTPRSVVRLDPALHKENNFSSGDPALDRLLRHAPTGPNNRQGATRTFVVSRDRRVIGFYGLPTVTVGSTTPAGQHEVTAVGLSGLAVAAEEQGRRLGSTLVLDALLTALRVAEDRTDARLAIARVRGEQRAAFLLRHGFQRLETDPTALYLALHDVRLTLAC